MRTRIVIVALLTVMVSSCAEPNVKSVDVAGHEKVSGYKPENVCDKNNVQLDSVMLGTLRHDPSVTNSGGEIKKTYHKPWLDLSDSSDGSVSCEVDMGILFSNGVTGGGLARVIYRDENALNTNPDHPADVQFKSNDVLLQEFLRKQEAAGNKQEQEEIATSFTPMRATDFDLDKRQLPAGKKVALNGYYWKYRGAEVLTDQPPAIPYLMDGQPKVDLVTNDTPSNAKDLMQACQRWAEGGCRVTLIGHADNCEYMLNGQAANADVCLFVDGSR